MRALDYNPDRFRDPVPTHPTNRSLSSLTAHGRLHMLLSGGEDGVLKFWDVRQTGAPLKVAPSKQPTPSRRVERLSSLPHWDR